MDDDETKSDTKFTLKPSEPIVLDAEELRLISQIALDKKKRKASILVPISLERLEMHIAAMERDIREFAEKGLFEVVWDFASINTPLHHVKEVSTEFKKGIRPFFKPFTQEQESLRSRGNLRRLDNLKTHAKML